MRKDYARGLSVPLRKPFAESDRLEAEIKRNLGGWGMNADWRRTTWGELIELKYGKALRDYKDGSGEYPVFGTNGAVGSSDKALCPFPGIVIGRKGAYRGVHFSERPFYVIDTAYYVNPKADFNIKWAYYHLLHQDINNLDSGSAIPSTSREDVYQLPAYVPPRPFQDYMVRVLDSFNSKIRINHQINQTLEQMAQAIFKSWFVDFEPVKAKIAALEADGSEEDALFAAMQAISGKDEDQLTRLQAEQPEQYVELRATAKLFPSAMQDSELGEIPEGWSVSQIGDLGTRIPVGKKYSQKTASETGNVPVLDQGKSGIIGYHNEKPGVSASPDDPVIVFANHTCYMRLIMHDFSAIQNVLPFRSKSAKTLNIFWLYFATLGKQGFIEYKGHWPDFTIKEIVVPDETIAGRFGSITKNLVVNQFKNEQQNETLSSIRDVLLPKLLSGELSVSDAEDRLAGAAKPANV